MSETKYGIPVGGELTLADGSKKIDDWLSIYNFGTTEVAKILEKETLSEKLSVVNTILQKRAYDQAMNLAKQAEQEKKYTLAIDKYKEALQYTKPLGYVDYYISENIKTLLLKVALQAEQEGNDSLALERYREALIYSVIGNKEPIKNNIKGVLQKMAQKAEYEENYLLALSTYKEVKRYSNTEGDCQKDIERVQYMLQAQKAEQEGNYPLALEKYKEVQKESSYTGSDCKKKIARIQYIMQAQQAKQNENYSLALEKYNEALKFFESSENDTIKKEIAQIVLLKKEKDAITMRKQQKKYHYEQFLKNAIFSVSSTKKVRFSPANLHFYLGTNSYRFAEHQWDCKFQDKIIKKRGLYHFMGNTKNVVDTLSDYRADIPIVNGGNTIGGGVIKGMWHVVTKEEWYYLIGGRENAGKKWGYSAVHGIKGVVLLPDKWDVSNGNPIKKYYTDYEWEQMELKGAVFLPMSEDDGYSTSSDKPFWENGSMWSVPYYISFYLRCELNYKYKDYYYRLVQYIGDYDDARLSSIIESLVSYEFEKNDIILPEKYRNVLFDQVEQRPTYKGEDYKVFAEKFVRQVLEYPSDAKKIGISGTVIVGFEVNKDGKVVNAFVETSVHPLLDNAALAAVSKLPNAIPGEQFGNKVRVFYSIPVQFKL